MAQRFRVEVAPGGGEERHAVLAGEIDLAAEPEVWEALEPALDGAERFVVDLGDVTFMDSTGLSVLVRAHRRLSHHGGRLVIGRASDVVARLLDVTGLDRLFGPDEEGDGEAGREPS